MKLYYIQEYFSLYAIVTCIIVFTKTWFHCNRCNRMLYFQFWSQQVLYSFIMNCDTVHNTRSTYVSNESKGCAFFTNFPEYKMKCFQACFRLLLMESSKVIWRLIIVAPLLKDSLYLIADIYANRATTISGKTQYHRIFLFPRMCSLTAFFHSHTINKNTTTSNAAAAANPIR